MNYTVHEFVEWDNLADYTENSTTQNLYVKWMITGFEEDIFVAEGDIEGSGYLFMKRSEEEGIMEIVQSSDEYENYIRVMLLYREQKRKEEAQYLN